MVDTVVPEGQAPAGENVEYVRTELQLLLGRYQIVRDVVNCNVKDLQRVYLLDPARKPANLLDEEDKAYYTAYHSRAIFYDFTSRTLNGFVGEIFSRDPEVKVPARLEAMVKDVTGDGLDLEQMAKKAATEVLSVGRYGIFVDYPQVTDRPSVLQLENGEVRPVMIPYTSENIVNWRTKSRQAKQVLSLVVLKEKYITADDGFEAQYQDQYRVLDLFNDQYRLRVWRKEDGFGSPMGDASSRTFTPRLNGAASDEIPFAFMGAEDNDPNPDNPPLYSMAQINIGHYRNSADFEDSVFLVGQPTLTISGLSKSWFKEILGGIIRMGSRRGIALEKDSKAEMLQAEPNSLVREAMQDKEKQMAAMGASFLRENDVQKTATEASIDDSARTSILSNAAKNVSAGLQYALEWAALYQGDTDGGIVFKLNSEFDLSRLGADERAQLIKDYDAGLLSWTECREALRKAGVATQTGEEAKAEIVEKQENDIAKAAAEFKATQPEPENEPTPTGKVA